MNGAGRPVAVDVWAQQVNQGFMQQPWLETLIRWTGVSREPPPPERLLTAMDDQSIEGGVPSSV